MVMEPKHLIEAMPSFDARTDACEIEGSRKKQSDSSAIKERNDGGKVFCKRRAERTIGSALCLDNYDIQAG
jgi:hypothetical protein